MRPVWLFAYNASNHGGWLNTFREPHPPVRDNVITEMTANLMRHTLENLQLARPVELLAGRIFNIARPPPFRT